MSDSVEQIKDRLSIVDVVAPYVKLARAGKHYKGLSPFNKEKTPSFYVSPDRGLYHCFSSGKGGDMFTFIQEMEGVDFRGALALLAEKAGVAIVNERPENRDRREKIYAVLDDAVGFFEDMLTRHADAQAYLEKRGITQKTVSEWNVGYAPSAWQDTLEYLIRKGHDAALIEAAGLVKKQETADSKQSTPNPRFYDRFRGRVMFPIRDASGRTVGFSGRIYPESAGEEQAKYINSPETSVFDKSRVLYGLNEAKAAVRKYNFAILVEGQFDVLAAHQTRYTNTIALSGTAFTEHHAALIKRHTENLVLAFDGDRAGVAASGRASAIALSKGLNVKIAALPPGQDPADIIQSDAALFKDAIKGATHVVDFYLTYLKNLKYDERRFKLEVSRVALPYVARIANAIDQAHFVSRVAEVLRVPEEAVWGELKKLSKPAAGYEPRRAHTPTESPSAHYEPFLSRGDTLERLLVGVMQSLDSSHPDIARAIQGKLHRLLGAERIQDVLNSPDEERVSVIEGDLFLEAHEQEGDLRTVIEELLADLEKELVRVRYRDAVVKLKHAEKTGDEKHVQELLEEVSVLAREL